MSKTPVTMPVLSDTMRVGRLARWLKQPGDAVKAGDVLAEVESDKAIMDIEAYSDGFLAGPLAPVDTDLPVKSTIAWIVDQPEGEMKQTEEPAPAKPESSALQADLKDATKTNHKGTPSPPTSPAQPDSSTRPDTTNPEIQNTIQRSNEPPSPVVAAALAHRTATSGTLSPFTRGLANALDVDLDQITPDAHGRIHAAQVLAAAMGTSAPHLELGPVHRIEKPSAMHAAMAEHMAQTVHTPTFHITMAVDLNPLHEAAHTTHQSLTLLIAQACARTIEKHPDFNACWTPHGLARRDRIDIGIAVDTPSGLLTPVIRDALRPLTELNEDWRELKTKLDNRRLMPADYSGATFYLTNLGQFALVEQFDAIVPTGAAAILAVAAPSHDRLTRLTLTCDHRVVAGADAARFLTTLDAQLTKAAGDGFEKISGTSG